MAMALYPKFKEALLNGDVALDTATIKALAVSSGYTYSSAHDFLNDVAAGRLGSSAALASKTTTNGTFDAADPTITVTADGTIVAVILYEDTGVESTSHLIAFIDKQADGSTAISQAVLTDDTVTVNIHASGLFDL